MPTEVVCFWTLQSAASAARRSHDTTTATSGFLPGTTSYVYVRCRTYTLRHRTSDVRCRTQHRTYDIVCTILHTILYIRHRTFVNIVGTTYDIVCLTYDIVGSGKSMSYTMSYVSENLRYRRFEIVYRIRCRRCLSYTMSYVFAWTYDVVCFVRYRIFLLFSSKTTTSYVYIRYRMYDIRCRTSHHVVCIRCYMSGKKVMLAGGRCCGSLVQTKKKTLHVSNWTFGLFTLRFHNLETLRFEPKTNRF